MLTPGRIVAPAPIQTFSATSIGPPVSHTVRSSVSTGCPTVMNVTFGATMTRSARRMPA
jgi:hypothetical protein